MLLSGPIAVMAMTEAFEWVPFELTWVGILWTPDALRKLFKLNTKAVGLIIRELDFWIPFVMMCLSFFSASVSFGHEAAVVQFVIEFMLSFTINVLLGKLTRLDTPTCTTGALRDARHAS
jgi:hypothetical protein